ncbi:glycosyltransferase family 2 protein [Bianquea renquensis]|jgi:glycosyltransferase, group 2 family|uniref:Glycosyltransferase family 2 protein n=1 Tax=Bianquea renquensis TaxID=2763661 RepID=A0A926DRD6_9FIRM|nr:glycosyltransferase family 2 protein [Bianquea renquensis]MBC8542394.1 glycosyltransferase family 2 protein [Bianquea renquensis]
MNPKVSVIVPVYNVEKYLERCIDSIRQQDYAEMEIILVDDGSTDNSPAICDKYASIDKRIVVIHKENGGLSSARNKGLEIATSIFVTFIDSDDWITRDYISYLMHMICKADADIAIIEYLKVKKGQKICCTTGDGPLEKWNTEEALIKYLEREIYPACGKMYKKALFIENKIEFPLGRIYEDIDTIFKAIKCARIICYSNAIKYFYWRDDKSITRTAFSEKNLDALTAFNNLSKESRDSNTAIKSLATFRLHKSYFSLLGVIAYYGWSSSISPKRQEEILTMLLQNFKLYFKECIFSQYVPFKRKCVMLMMRINFKFTCKLIGWVRRLG